MADALASGASLGNQVQVQVLSSAPFLFLVDIFMENSLTLKKNIPWVGIVKSIGVFLVFIGHIWSHSRLEMIYKAIYSFHMPLFFILAGFLFSSKDTFMEMTKKKLFRVLLPGLFYNILFSPLYFVYTEKIDISEFISGLFFFRGEVTANPPCWFFFTLFFTFIVAKLVRVDRNKAWVNLMISLLSFGIGYVLFRHVAVKNDFFGVKELFPALGLFSFGIIVRKLDLSGKVERNRIASFITFTVSGIIWFIFGLRLNGKVAFYGADFGNYLYFVISGIAGSVALICLVIFITSFKPLDKAFSKINNYPSAGSILLIGSHYFFMMMYVSYMVIDGYEKTLVFDIVSPIFVLITLIIYYPVYKFCSKRLPFLVGEYIPNNSTH